METHFRSIAKVISWRVIATLVTTLVVLIYSGELAAAALVGLSDSIAKIGLYWAHERAWHKIQWGRVIPTVHSP